MTGIISGLLIGGFFGWALTYSIARRELPMPWFRLTPERSAFFFWASVAFYAAMMLVGAWFVLQSLF